MDAPYDSGKYVMEDLQTVGGTPAVLKYLLENGMIHGDCMTVTGKTMAENLAEVPGLTEGQDIIRPLSNPVKKTGHLTILKGNLAPEVSCLKNAIFLFTVCAINTNRSEN
jgi:dihydroxy-acid dehydratase